jgi:hypothetical protein
MGGPTTDDIRAVAEGGLLAEFSSEVLERRLTARPTVFGARAKPYKRDQRGANQREPPALFNEPIEAALPDLTRKLGERFATLMSIPTDARRKWRRAAEAALI